MQTLAHDPRRVDADEALALLEKGDAILIDIRHATEHAFERIPGARLVPEERIDELKSLDSDKPVILYCRTSRRTAAAVDHLAALGKGVVHLDGGIDAWKKKGYDVERTPGAPMFSVMQQVQITAGSMVLISAALGAFVSPAWLGLTAFVGAGLLFTGLSGWCGMATVLAKMPWNKTGGGACSPR